MPAFLRSQHPVAHSAPYSIIQFACLILHMRYFALDEAVRAGAQ
ncbi:hypothetical protein [Kordiimonas sp.]